MDAASAHALAQRIEAESGCAVTVEPLDDSGLFVVVAKHESGAGFVFGRDEDWETYRGAFLGIEGPWVAAERDHALSLPPIERHRRRIQATTGSTVNLLAAGVYEAVANRSQGRRFSAADLEAAVTALGSRLIEPSVVAYEDLAIRTVALEPPRFEVHFRLWTAESGRSEHVLVLGFEEQSWDRLALEVISIGDRAQ